MQGVPVLPEHIEAAAERIHGHVRVTPVLDPGSRAFGIDAALTLKLELFQHTGSFKPRGAFHRILTGDVPERGLITSSGGNHAQAVAYVAHRLGLPAEIFVPCSAPEIKVRRLHRYRATVFRVGEVYDDAREACEARAAETGAMMVHAYDHPDIVAGAGTFGREIDWQVPDFDTVLVAVGGGGLIGGTAAWFQDRVRVVSVEPEGCPTLERARTAGRPVQIDVGGIAADSLGARRIGEVPFAIARRYVDDSILVPGEALLDAQRSLWEELRIVAEPGGVAALAALISGRYRPRTGERIVVPVCGGNTDPGTVDRSGGSA